MKLLLPQQDLWLCRYDVAPVIKYTLLKRRQHAFYVPFPGVLIMNLNDDVTLFFLYYG